MLNFCLFVCTPLDIRQYLNYLPTKRSVCSLSDKMPASHILENKGEEFENQSSKDMN